jgi:GTP cyclohydrolase II
MELPVIRHIASCKLPTEWGLFIMHGYISVTGDEGFCLEIGQPSEAAAPLVRVHSECLTGESLHSRRCDCGPQLDAALAAMAAEHAGLLVYLRQEGRGIGLMNKIRAYALQDEGLDTVDANLRLGFPADAREYQMAAAIILQRQLQSIRLLSNNPEKHQALTQAGIRIVERVPLTPGATKENRDYLRTKVKRMGHLF